MRSRIFKERPSSRDFKLPRIKVGSNDFCREKLSGDGDHPPSSNPSKRLLPLR